MPQRPLRSTLAALLLGTTLLLPCLTGSAAGAAEPAPRRAAAVTSAPAGPFSLLWQTLVQLVQGGSLAGGQAASGNRARPNAGCGPSPDGRCTTTSPGDAG